MIDSPTRPLHPDTSIENSSRPMPSTSFTTPHDDRPPFRSPSTVSSSLSATFRLPAIEPLEDETRSSISSHLQRSHRRRLNPFHSSSRVTKSIIVDEAYPPHEFPSTVLPSAPDPPETDELPPGVLPPATLNPDAHHLDEINEPEWVPPPVLTSRPTNSSSIKLSVAVRRAGTAIRHGHPDGSNRRVVKAERKRANRLGDGEVEVDDEECVEEGERTNNGHERGRLGKLTSSLGLPGSKKGHGGSFKTLKHPRSDGTHHHLPLSSSTSPPDHAPARQTSQSKDLAAAPSLAPSSPTNQSDELYRPTSKQPLLSTSPPREGSSPLSRSRSLSQVGRRPSGSDLLEIPLPSRLPKPSSTPSSRPTTPDPTDPHRMPNGQIDPLDERIDLGLVRSTSEAPDKASSMQASSSAISKSDGSVVWERLWENQRGEFQASSFHLCDIPLLFCTSIQAKRGSLYMCTESSMLWILLLSYLCRIE